jgi:alkane 1-monooxygenase
MILLALVPPLWRRVMDRRVLAHYGGDASRANLTRRARAELVSASPVAADNARVNSTTATTSATPADLSVSAYRCPGCSYTYDVSQGDRREGFAPGTPWSSVPDTWCCPDCGVREKIDFVSVDSVRAHQQ